MGHLGDGSGEDSNEIASRPLSSDYDASDIYVSLHTNGASGDCYGGCPTGTETYYDASSEHATWGAVSLNLAEQTRKVLATLTPREEKVLRMRFGIGEKADHTLEEVGSDFAVTRERIRQIEAKALRKLRHPTRSRKLKHFIES